MIAVQRAPAPPPAEPPSDVIPAAAATGTALAVLAALAALKPARDDDGGNAAALALAAAAVAHATVAILVAFDQAHVRRREGIEGRVVEMLAGGVSGIDAEQLRPLVRAEVERERTFQAKARARLEQDLPSALSLTDPGQRSVRVKKILDRERRYAEQREDAIAARAGGQVELERLKRILVPQAVTGMFWRINPRLEHCARCSALAGRIWPWRLLDLFQPPMHLHCGCRLWTPEDAFRMGWATKLSVASVDEAISMMHLLEAAPDPAWDPEGLWLVEAGACGCAP